MTRKKKASPHLAAPAAPAHLRLIEFLPPLAAGALLLVLMWLTWDAMSYYTMGHFAYSLDDAYIHMAIAKNLARHGVWGATRFEFTSSSSSVLWTLSLAMAFFIGGVRDQTALALTTISSLGAIAVADYVLRKLSVHWSGRLAALVLIVVMTPLPTLIFGGMEHPLQILIDIAFLHVASLLIVAVRPAWDRLAYGALFLAALTTAIRFEGAALVGVAVVLLALRRDWQRALGVAAAGAFPVVAFGVVAVSQGSYFLPNSVLVKNAESMLRILLSEGPAQYAVKFGAHMREAMPVLMLMVLCLGLLLYQKRKDASFWDERLVLPTMALSVSAIHLTVGQVGWFYRYEAYMVAILILAVAVQLSHVVSLTGTAKLASFSWLTVAVLTALALYFGLSRGWSAWQATPRASENVYEQMLQTAQFLRRNPQYKSVAVGDLGAVAYYNDDLRILDLEGLAERGVPLSHLGRDNATSADIAARAREDRSQIAIVFPEYFDLPDDWVEVARWHIANNIVAYADTVAFLAIPPTDPEGLASDVRKYTQERLPKSVGAEGLPIEPQEQ